MTASSQQHSSSCPPATKHLTTSSGAASPIHRNCFKHSLNSPEFRRTPWRHRRLLTEQGWRQNPLLSQHGEKAEVSRVRARSTWFHQSPAMSFRRLSLNLPYGFSSARDEHSKVLGAFCIGTAQQGQPKGTLQSSQGIVI